MSQFTIFIFIILAGFGIVRGVEWFTGWLEESLRWQR